MAVDEAAEGKVERSLRLLRVSWRHLRAHPRLLTLPLISAVACVAAAVLVFLPVRDALPGLAEKPRDIVALAAMALPLTFATVFCNVGFLAMARSAERGEPVSVRQGLRCAAGLLPSILLWSLLTWSVGALLSLLQEIPGGGGVIGRVAGWLGGLAWGLATFFVVPVLVIERQGTLASVRTSARTFRRRWGEAVTADVGIGTVTGFAMLPGLGLVVGGIAISSTALTFVGLLWVAPMLAFESALTQLFTLQLYCEDAVGPFEASDLSAAVRPR